ncbi:uncharacterized protein LOC119435475 [Dermacentor silvarum]|uniref:uncharacterized protein LOC119435475 n=1 Tax=Dermacentor silvarum TaxID=543639 RepID=UPI001898F345|nr:uncharacterized protein LOC119435475 [Dermacentor silvarum]
MEKEMAALVRNCIAATQHLTAQRGCQHTLVELHSRGIRNTENVFVLNMYCRPTKKGIDMAGTIQDAVSKAGSRPLLVLGDFNAPHTTWGYRFCSKRGRELAHLIEQHNLTLLNEPDTPTRMGTSTTRDTTPDLSLLMGTLDVSWQNVGTNLGSDHDIIRITIRGPTLKVKTGTARITNWYKLRKEQEEESDEEEWTIRQTYETWEKQQLDTVEKHTQKIATTHQTPRIDARLAHLWETRSSLTERWKRQRHNKKLRKRIREINDKAAEYAADLCKESWLDLCDSLQGTLSTRKTWQLLRHLIDPMTSKSETNRSTARTLNNYEGDVEKLMEDMKNKYIKTEKSKDRPGPYRGLPNEKLDKPFTGPELRIAIAESNQKSAAGPDTVTYRLLNNLSDRARAELLRHMNETWESGKLPRSWKEAEVRFIPKQGKPPHIDNLRPISHTSCVGKHLSTQDVLIQIKEEVMKEATRHSPRAIHARGEYALDLKGAFDNVSHVSILTNLQSTGCGERTYNYGRCLLTDRKARIRVGEEVSPLIELGSRGTPQGTVLSPLLFNMALLHLPKALEAIEGLGHALYADDVSLWTTKAGSHGWMQDTLHADGGGSGGQICQGMRPKMLATKVGTGGSTTTGAEKTQGRY